MGQRLCSGCGKKITGAGTYYWLEDVLGLRLKCKECLQKLSGKTDKEMENE